MVFGEARLAPSPSGGPALTRYRSYIVGAVCVYFETRPGRCEVAIADTSDGYIDETREFALEDYAEAWRCFVQTVAMLARLYRDMRAAGWKLQEHD